MTSDRSETTLPETVRRWDARAQEWTSVTVQVAPLPRPARPAARASRPIAYVPENWPEASNASPIDPIWRATAFADQGPLADLRSYLPAATIRTHRAAVVMPSDPGRITAGR